MYDDNMNVYSEWYIYVQLPPPLGIYGLYDVWNGIFCCITRQVVYVCGVMVLSMMLDGGVRFDG